MNNKVFNKYLLEAVSPVSKHGTKRRRPAISPVPALSAWRPRGCAASVLPPPPQQVHELPKSVRGGAHYIKTHRSIRITSLLFLKAPSSVADPDPLVRGTATAPAPDSSIIKRTW